MRFAKRSRALIVAAAPNIGLGIIAPAVGRPFSARPRIAGISAGSNHAARCRLEAKVSPAVPADRQLFGKGWSKAALTLMLGNASVRVRIAF